MSEKVRNKPLVSVIIPCYNHESYVIETIQSIIDQDYENIELIIIDDGSNDDSVIRIKEMIPLCKKRFKRFEFRSRLNKGLCATLNEALDWCEGEYFSPIASDDIALPHKTSFLIDKIKNSNYAAVFGTVQPFNDLKERYSKLEEGSTYVFEDIMLHLKIPSAPAVMLKKSAVTKVGGYAEDVKLEDRYMWLALTNNGEKLISFPETVVLYRQHNTNTTSNIREMQKHRIEVLNKFIESPLHSKAIKNSYLVCARGLSNKEVLAPISIIMKSKNYNKSGAFIIVRALAPNFLIKLLKAFR
ncbi:glycosyltransferase family 2 protein [Psychrobacter submarinus]|uniref:glycosyltransferase family 2 protein n=1 Tax=Psychrobacter submarinus TaxID=154108 RepID=UPI001919C0CA|nr:glycosyltransferase family 2 protein [Psychrobacter submarinus]